MLPIRITGPRPPRGADDAGLRRPGAGSRPSTRLARMPAKRCERMVASSSTTGDRSRPEHRHDERAEFYSTSKYLRMSKPSESWISGRQSMAVLLAFSEYQYMEVRGAMPRRLTSSGGIIL